jgi:hypothetical protein
MTNEPRKMVARHNLKPLLDGVRQAVEASQC